MRSRRWLAGPGAAFLRVLVNRLSEGVEVASRRFSAQPTFVLWAGRRNWFGSYIGPRDAGFAWRTLAPPPRPGAGVGEAAAERDDTNTGLFLLPDRLVWHFRLAAFLLLVVLYGRASLGSWTLERPWSLLLNWGVFSFALVLLVGPYLVYGQARWPALASLGRELPSTYRGWLLPAALGGRQRERCRRPSLMIAGWMLWRWRRSRMPVAFAGRRSRQRVLIRLAMEEVFNRFAHDNQPAAKLRFWFFYALAPAWLMLVAMALFVALGAPRKEDLLGLSIAWCLSSVVFFVIEWRRQIEDLTLTAEDMASLPIQVRRPENALGRLIDTRHFQVALSVAVVVVAALLLAVGQLLESPEP